MPTGYDLLEHSHEFRMHWLKRIAAGLIDAALIFIPVTIVVYLVAPDYKEIVAGVFSGFGWFLYSTILESVKGTTIGKSMVGLFVASLDGPMTLSKAIIRNIAKMFWYVFLPFDIIIGLLNHDDPRMRWTDGISNTTIIKKNKK